MRDLIRVEMSIPFFFSGEKREGRSREVNIFSLRRRGPIGKDMWGVGVILSVSVRLLVFILVNLN